MDPPDHIFMIGRDDMVPLLECRAALKTAMGMVRLSSFMISNLGSEVAEKTGI